MRLIARVTSLNSPVPKALSLKPYESAIARRWRE